MAEKSRPKDSKKKKVSCLQGKNVIDNDGERNLVQEGKWGNETGGQEREATEIHIFVKLAVKQRSNNIHNRMDNDKY